MTINFTLFIEDEIVVRASELASRRGTSLNQMVRDYLRDLASDLNSDEILRELDSLWQSGSQDSGGRHWTRENLHERTRVR